MQTYKQKIAGTATYEKLVIDNGRAEIFIVSGKEQKSKWKGGSGDAVVSRFIHNSVKES